MTPELYQKGVTLASRGMKLVLLWAHHQLHLPTFLKTIPKKKEIYNRIVHKHSASAIYKVRILVAAYPVEEWGIHYLSLPVRVVAMTRARTRRPIGLPPANFLTPQRASQDASSGQDDRACKNVQSLRLTHGANPYVSIIIRSDWSDIGGKSPLKGECI
jgi:hypothetical protein